MSVICLWLHDGSHLPEQKQELGQDATWRTIYFAQQFIEILLTANAGFMVEKEAESYLVPKHVTYQLEHIYQQLRRRSGQVQGSARFGLSLCLDQNTATASNSKSEN